MMHPPLPVPRRAPVGAPHAPTPARAERMLVLALASFIGLLVWCGTVSYRAGDSRFSLLVTQSLLEHQTIKLDAYVPRDPLLRHHFQITQVNQHVYYYFPIGASLSALPVVWLAHHLGYDMLDPHDDAVLQHLLAALTCGALTAVAYRLCRCYVAWPASVVITLLTVAGSSLVSTLGTALWSTNLSVVWTCLSLRTLSHYDTKRQTTWHPYWLASTLFASYLCRPVVAVFVPLCLVFLVRSDWSAAVRCFLTLLVLGLGFSVAAYAEYGAYLPPYYVLGRLGQAARYESATVLYGLLFSPGRGFFTFSPHMLVVAVTLGTVGRRLPLRMPALLGGWIATHLLVILTFDHWWGGHSYGPRLLTDTLPAWLLLTAIGWRVIAASPRRQFRYGVVAVYLVTGSFASWIHAWNGLYNAATLDWNTLPVSIDAAPQRLFDWHLPQFLATQESLCASGIAEARARQLPHAARLRGIRAGEIIEARHMTQQADKVALINWWLPEGPTLWSACPEAAVLFGPAFANDIMRADRISVSLASRTEQTIRVSLNEVWIGTVTVGSAATTHELWIDDRLWNSTSNNRLSFVIPEQTVASGDDPRHLGIALAWIRFGGAAPEHRVP